MLKCIFLFLKVPSRNIVVITFSTKVNTKNTRAEGTGRYRRRLSRKLCSTVSHSWEAYLQKNRASGFGYFNTHVTPTYSTCWRLLIPTLLYNYVVQTVPRQAVLSLKCAPCFGPAENTKCLWAVPVTTCWGQLQKFPFWWLGWQKPVHETRASLRVPRAPQAGGTLFL